MEFIKYLDNFALNRERIYIFNHYYSFGNSILDKV